MSSVSLSVSIFARAACAGGRVKVGGGESSILIAMSTFMAFAVDPEGLLSALRRAAPASRSCRDNRRGVIWRLIFGARGL